ncbi:MAG: hypothetical protein UU56_C0012G0008 [Candidatus Curtissbacteria bacterium GW2011_GWA2_41_24]|uniref:Uncharacterized protein n=1 Tax=Candidatus Curtissbacteria bacterium GW2011_GWA2_41_24 TaxID=1618411 RepID=A0A0G0VSR8_9BACT|nr:MAG: hypothetical protein UU56_C0012G0008 [Candidatus Curtissbacteria bacterium GW2011_GWA2_41_24]
MKQSVGQKGNQDEEVDDKAISDIMPTGIEKSKSQKQFFDPLTP